jgi:rhodanese-related sulfurtransferase
LELISREELKQKLDGGEDVKLLCTLGEWAYRGVHIVGSIHVDSREKAAELLALDDQDVKRYAGGLEEWEAAGYPLEGELV